MVRYQYRRTRVDPNQEIEIPDNAQLVNTIHFTPPNRSPRETYVEWFEPLGDFERIEPIEE